jgi:flagellar biosynthesis protein FlhF
MQPKIFRAANLQAALEEIREQLGPNASVLRTRQCRDGWMGWLGRSYVEVTASSGDERVDDQQEPSRIVISGRVPLGDDTDRSNAHGRPSNQRVSTGHRPIDSRQTPSLPGVEGFSVISSPHSIDRLLPDSDADNRMGLISLGVAPAVADRWIRSTSGFAANLGDRFEQPWLEQMRRSVAREVRLSGPIQLNPGARRIVALIGPTGVGKTTTVAKLAAGFRIQSKRRVGLLTIDTFRIAAVQQLQAYAQIMDLPMSVVESADQMRDAIERLGDVDLILIDTAGRSPKGDMNVESLANLLGKAQPDETHLVISATSTAAVVRSTIDGFAAARPTATILTKLDEAPYTAGVLSAITSSNQWIGMPVSYITNGQHVPEDIAIATTDRLLARLLPSQIDIPQIAAA